MIKLLKYGIPVALLLVIAAVLMSGMVQLPNIGNNEPAPIKLGANETIVGYTPAGVPIIGEKNKTTQDKLPVTLEEKPSGQNNPEQPPGLPATSWNWAGRTASWANVLSKTEPTGFSYSGSDYNLYIPENDLLRSVVSFDELNNAWLAVYGPGFGYKFSDTGAGANGLFAQLLRTSNVQIYQGALDEQGKRNLIIPYPWGTEGITRYTFVGKNAQGKLEKYELKLNSDLTNVRYANQPEPTPAKEQPAKETANPEDKSSGDGGLTGGSSTSSTSSTGSSDATGGLT